MTTNAGSSMSPLPERLASLSPAKRALLEQLRRDTTNTPATEPVRQHIAGEPAPLSLGQERLWFLDQLEPGNPFYNVAVATRIVGPLDAGLLAASLQAVIERHDSLRTVFRTVAGRPEQIVCPTIRFQLAQDDLSTLTAAARGESLVNITNAEAIRPFDLARGPLIRARVVRLAEQEHVLLLTLHHIICDGWSLAILRREVAEQYIARRAGCTCECKSLPLSFADHAIRERSELDSPRTARNLRFWREQLSDLPGPLELPLDRPRPAVQSYRGQTSRRRIIGPLVDDLRHLAAQENGTLCMVLLAAFQVLLARYSSQHDVCVGMPIAGRTRSELERLIGFFVNTLVIRGRLDEQSTFRELLRQTRATLLDAYEHQDLPFSRLVDELLPERDLRRNPLVQVMFVLQNIPVATRQVADLAISDSSFDHAPVANFDLTLNIDEHPDRLDLSLVYNTDLFDAATADRLLESYQVLLSALVKDQEIRISALPVLPEVEKHKLLVAWNETTVPTPDDQSIVDLLTRQAQRTPHGVAVRYEGQELSYEQLECRSNRLARYLIQQGATVDAPLGVCLGRSPEVIVAILGILKAGAAYLPIDPLYPQSRRAAMIVDARLRLVVSDLETAACLPPGDYRVVLVDAVAAAIEDQSDAPLTRAADADNVAYIIYTSGSTGLPKGVQVEHRGLVNHALELARRCDLQPGDSLLQYLSLSFDAAAEEIFPALISGATLHLHPAPAELAGRSLLEWSRSNRVNVLHLPAVVWTALVDDVVATRGKLAQHLKIMVVGGDSLPSERVRSWCDATRNHCRFLFAYGVTEATITSTLFDPLDTLPATASTCLPIGRPIANTRLYVLDELRRPVPVGVPGELYIGGMGVARGYLDRPELTSERFVPDPFSEECGARLYRTGDRVRYLADGNLEFLGRIDRQVKVNGHRIEPAEIEAVLQLHPRVHEAIVVPRGEGHARRLAAYVGCGAGVMPTADELREFLSSRLPGQMLPAGITVLSELPRLTCAKVDVSALPEPSWGCATAGADFVPPTCEAEQVLVAIWSEVLGRVRVGIHDNFFDIGGDSIRSIQVVARAGAAGWKITPKQLFQNQTIAELARVAEQKPVVSRSQEPVTGAVPLLPIQHEFFAHSAIERHHHNQAVMLAVSPSVTPKVIDQALRLLFVQHDALRARFVQDERGEWTQEYLPPEFDQPFLEIVNIATMDAAEGSRSINRAAEAAQAGLDLGQGPIARFVYFDGGVGGRSRLLAVIHHLVIDAVSWRILLADLEMVCRQIAAGQPAELPAKTSSVGEWSQRLHEYAHAKEVRTDLSFWAAVAQRTKSLPCEKNAGENLVAAEHMAQACLDRATTEILLCETQTSYRARVQEILLAALVQVLRDYAGPGPVVLNLESHGREDWFPDVDLSRTVGWFTSLYPARFEAPSQGSLGTLVRAVKEQYRAIPAGGLSYGLLRWLADETRTELAGLPQPDICFNFLGNLDHSLPRDAWLTLAEESPGAIVGPRARRRHIWEIIALVQDSKLHIKWHYSRALHHDATIQQLLTKYVSSLRTLVESGPEEEGFAASPGDFALANIDADDFQQLQRLLSCAS